MAYKIERSRLDHELLVQNTLMSWNYQDHDLHLLTSEGHRIYTNKALLSFYSIIMKDILNDPVIAFSFNVPSVSVPATHACVSLLLKILVEGKTKASEEVSIFDVKELAEVLGIELPNLIFDQPNTNPKPKEVLGTQLPNHIFGQTNNNPKPKKQKTNTKNLDIQNEAMNDIVQQSTIKEEPLESQFKEEHFEKISEEVKKVWECSICKKKYTEKKGMLRHKRRYHKDQQDDMTKSQIPLEENVSNPNAEERNPLESEEVDENEADGLDTSFESHVVEENFEFVEH